MARGDWEKEQYRIKKLTEKTLIEIIEDRHVSPVQKLEAIKILREMKGN